MASALGMKLRRLREAKGFTLQQVADAVGCTKAYIWELEVKGGQRPSADRIYALSKVLGVTVEDLLEDQPGVVPEASPEDIQFFRNYVGMTEEDKQRYQQMLQLMFGMRKDDGEGR